MTSPGFLADLLGHLAYGYSKAAPFLLTNITITASALVPIFTGAHASLSRPSSAAKPRKRKGGRHGKDDDSSQRMEGLSMADAILFPFIALAWLAAIYYLLKWLDDPALFNKILNWYISSIMIPAAANMLSDLCNVVLSFAFPDRFYDAGGSWKVDAESRSFLLEHVDPIASGQPPRRSSPLPGMASRIPLPPLLIRFLWRIREVLLQPAVHIELTIRGFFEVSTGLRVLSILSGIFAVASVLYFNLVSKPWWLYNIYGFSVSYNALQLMSPTTFATGTLLLGGLFFYDIYAVFYTPMMIEVANKVEAPIKLLVPRVRSEEESASRAFALIGLGDIVIPGIMIGLALRFDLFMFYLKRQKKKTSTNEKESLPAQSSTSKVETKPEALVYGKDGVGKAVYRTAAGGWGERFWLKGSEMVKYDGGKFPKPYFLTSIFAYTLGMTATFGVMIAFDHGQPALLYLVPSILIGLWGTALFRGELKQMYGYSELDEEEEIKPGEEKTNGKDNRGNEADQSNKESTAKASETANSRNSVPESEGGMSKKPRLFTFSLRRTDDKDDRGIEKPPKLAGAVEESLAKVSNGPVGTGEVTALEQKTGDDEGTRYRASKRLRVS